MKQKTKIIWIISCLVVAASFCADMASAAKCRQKLVLYPSEALTASE